MTEQERKIYQKIKRKAAKEILADAFIPNRSGNTWMHDFGDYAAYIYIEPCHGGGVFVNLHLSFFWRVSQDILDWSPVNGRVSAPGITDAVDALLYKENPPYDFGGPAEPIPDPAGRFGQNFRTLLRAARETALAANFGGDYAKMLRLIWKIRAYGVNRAFDEYGKRLDLAIVAYLSGDTRLGTAILKEMAAGPGNPNPFADQLLAKCADPDAFRALIRERVAAGRALIQQKFPKFDPTDLSAGTV